MARRKTLPDSVQAKFALAERLRMLRSELYGERGGPELARRLGLPIRTWYNYESGVTIPAEVVLKIIELTSVEPMWLLHGQGPKFRTTVPDRAESLRGGSVSVGGLLRTALQILESSESLRRVPTPTHRDRGEHVNGDQGGSTAHDVALIEVADADQEPLTRRSGPRYLEAQGEWLDAERDCRCIQVVGDAMAPILMDGACVAFAKTEEPLVDLDGKMVVAWIDHQPIVRWFQNCDKLALLRAENPATVPNQLLVDLESRNEDRMIRRVLWINTPH
jgi:phage repressor protein C with HTH and peptisase S24 domain